MINGHPSRIDPGSSVQFLRGRGLQVLKPQVDKSTSIFNFDLMWYLIVTGKMYVLQYAILCVYVCIFVFKHNLFIQSLDTIK